MLSISLSNVRFLIEVQVFSFLAFVAIYTVKTHVYILNTAGRFPNRLLWNLHLNLNLNLTWDQNSGV